MKLGREENNTGETVLPLATSADSPGHSRVHQAPLSLCRLWCLSLSTAVFSLVLSSLSRIRATELLRRKLYEMILQIMQTFFLLCVTLFWRCSKMKLCSSALQIFFPYHFPKSVCSQDLKTEELVAKSEK